LEHEQVRLAGRRQVDDRVQPVAIGLVVVERIVLERRDDALALDAVDASAPRRALTIGSSK
jgi:hypothetical protein